MIDCIPQNSFNSLLLEMTTIVNQASEETRGLVSLSGFVQVLKNHESP